MPLRSLLLMLIAGAILPATSSATTWNLRSNWSDVSNPNGRWTCRHGAAALPHVAAWQPSGLGYTQPAWSVGEHSPQEYLPAWFRASGVLLDWQIGDVVVHTTDPANGPSQGLANVIWTSPDNYTVQLSGHLWLARDIGRSVNWQLYRNSTLLTSGSLSSGDPYDRGNPMLLSAGTGGAAALQNVAVQASDVFELRLITTSSNNLGDFVGVEWSIAAPPPVPIASPFAIALLAAALLATAIVTLGSARGRRRAA